MRSATRNRARLRTLTVAPYDPGSDAEWDELVRRSPMATFLHTRAFLSYHGDRFMDASVVLRDERGTLVGVLPAATVPDEPWVVASHPGATFGGLVHAGALGGSAMLDALPAIVAHYREQGFERLRYVPVPHIYHQSPSADDVYGLFRAGAARTQSDLSCAVDLETGIRLSSGRRGGLAKARRERIEVAEGDHLLGELWPVIEENLARRHGARPVHTEAEIRRLTRLLPDEINVVVGRHLGEAVAGVLLFDTPRVSHTQYIASSEAGNRARALDAVLCYCLERAGDRGARFFDFGTCSLHAGKTLNDGLYAFKARFGGGGVACDQYEVALRGAAPEPGDRILEPTQAA